MAHQCSVSNLCRLDERGAYRGNSFLASKNRLDWFRHIRDGVGLYFDQHGNGHQFAFDLAKKRTVLCICRRLGVCSDCEIGSGNKFSCLPFCAVRGCRFNSQQCDPSDKKGTHYCTITFLSEKSKNAFFFLKDRQPSSFLKKFPPELARCFFQSFSILKKMVLLSLKFPLFLFSPGFHNFYGFIHHFFIIKTSTT